MAPGEPCIHCSGKSNSTKCNRLDYNCRNSVLRSPAAAPAPAPSQPVPPPAIGPTAPTPLGQVPLAGGLSAAPFNTQGPSPGSIAPAPVSTIPRGHIAKLAKENRRLDNLARDRAAGADAARQKIEDARQQMASEQQYQFPGQAGPYQMPQAQALPALGAYAPGSLSQGPLAQDPLAQGPFAQGPLLQTPLKKASSGSEYSGQLRKGKMKTGCIPCLAKGKPCDPSNPGCKLAMSDDWRLNYENDEGLENTRQQSSGSATTYRPTYPGQATYGASVFGQPFSQEPRQDDSIGGASSRDHQPTQAHPGVAPRRSGTGGSQGSQSGYSQSGRASKRSRNGSGNQRTANDPDTPRDQSRGRDSNYSNNDRLSQPNSRAGSQTGQCRRAQSSSRPQSRSTSADALNSDVDRMSISGEDQRKGNGEKSSGDNYGSRK